jgi:putative transposase
LRTDAYYQDQQRIGYHDTSAQLTLLKQHTPWLQEVSSVPLQQALSHLDRAFRAFFEGRANYPTFKTKHGPQAATFTTSAFRWDGKQLTLAKMDAPLDIHWSRPLPEGCKPSTVTITKDCATSTASRK